MNYNGFSYNDFLALSIKKPIMAQLELTRNCNQECFFCFRTCHASKTYQNLTLSQWKEAIDKLTIFGIEEINFSGGEIFLYPNATELFNYARSKGIKKITVNTNGQVALTKLDLSSINVLVLSVHSLGKLHDNITGTEGSFARIINNLNYLKKYNSKLDIGINVVVTSGNINVLRNLYTNFKKFNIEFFSFILKIDRKNYEENKKEISAIFPKYLEFVKSLPSSKLELTHGMRNFLIQNINFYKNPISLPDCAAGKYKIVIDYRGNIYPCRFFQTKSFYCGNVLRDNLKVVWERGKGYKYFRNLLEEKYHDKKCLSCIKRKKCLGGCLAWRKINKKGLYEKDFKCELGSAYIRA